MDKDDIPKTTFLIEGKPPVRLYKKRWIILLTYFIIVPIKHYNVSFEAVNWTFLVTLINLVVFCYPSCYVVDKFGIKIGALCGMGGTVLAAWIKFFSIPPERFWLIILAQAVLSLPQMCLISLGPKLSANWFGPDEVAMANSIGITGLQLGMALGFILPPILVKKETVERDLRTTAIGLAIICTIAFAMVFISTCKKIAIHKLSCFVLVFADKPFIPPSQAIQKKNEKIQYLKTFNSLIKNVPYLLISLGVGSNAGILCLIQSLLNQIIITHYPDGEKDAGLMGLFMMVFCIIGCCLSGAVLTKFKIYRLHYWFSTLFVSVALIMFLTTLNENIIFPYVGICLYGFFFGTLWNVFYEIVVEITYPEPEAMSIGLVYCLGQSLSVGYIYLYSFLFYDISVTSANYFLITITLGIKIGALCGMGGTVLAAWIKFFSIPPERFWLIILAQAVLSIPQMCLISLEPKLSANWFGPEEIAMANSIGITGLQVSLRYGIRVNKETAERDLRTTAIGLAIICTIAFAIVFIIFADKPLVPPSQSTQKKSGKVQYLKTFNSLIKNVPYLFILVGVGSNAGIPCLIQTLLNQIIITHYPVGEKDAGLMGLLMMIFGIIGCCFSSAVLTKFKIYRNLFVWVRSPSSLCACPKKYFYRFFFGTLWNVFYEIVIEITYPEPEAITIGLMYCLGQSLSIGYIYLYSFLFYNGIRYGALFAMSGATLGAWIKFYATASNKFWLIIVGQMFLSVPQMSLIGIGPKLSVDWFGSDEMSIANSIGIVGLQLGYALGFVLPPMLVKKETAERDLYNSALGLGIICTTALVIVVLFFEDKPPQPPSQATLKKSNKIQYLKSIKKLLKNTSYLLLVLVVGTHVTVLCLIQSLLNQIVLKYYATGEEDAGFMGLLMMVFCIIGCFSCGAILTKFKTYKLCYCTSNFLMGVTLTIFLNTLEIGILFPYIAISLYGFFYGLFWNVSYEITVEFTYPEPEAITFGLMYTVAQTLSIGSIYLYSFLFYEISDKWANNFMVISVFLCFITTLCTKYNLERAAANTTSLDINEEIHLSSIS
ncbi:hypothetical protein FQR65_LT11024 [Abscondita terminalis]|nr:hypothetical protein FQR65_LT11024 [Abscondita terminalis]